MTKTSIQQHNSTLWKNPRRIGESSRERPRKIIWFFPSHSLIEILGICGWIIRVIGRLQSHRRAWDFVALLVLIVLPIISSSTFHKLDLPPKRPPLCVVLLGVGVALSQYYGFISISWREIVVLVPFSDSHYKLVTEDQAFGLIIMAQNFVIFLLPLKN